MLKRDFLTALYYLDRGIEKMPNSKEMLYKRAVCKHGLGNSKGAFKEFKKLQQLGDQSATESLQKWSNGKY